MKKLLSIILILISFNVLSQTYTCICTYISAYEWDLAPRDITFKSKLGDTFSFITYNTDADKQTTKKFEDEFWNEDRSDQVNGGINKTVTKNIGKTYLIIYELSDQLGEGGMMEFKHVLSFVTSP
ncbi:MAG TPA: hypothetical protein VMX17_01045 [Candidatus Glassbacteria bacterium]|nr:hypothetical protein [Candidatus Glassbacteria bacterium]